MPSHAEDAHRALASWARFPVDREPRPIVLTGLSTQSLERLAADRRWRTIFDGPGVAESELPADIVAAAVDYCRDVQTGAPRPLARIIRGDGPFGTDRGIRDLPAWMMYPGDRRWPFIAMDPEFERRMTWRPERVGHSSANEASALADDGRTLTYRFIGAPMEYVAYPHAEVFESETAVVVSPVAVDLVPPDSPRLAYAEPREVVVRLAVPLGNRVLVTPASGSDPDLAGPPTTVIVPGGTP